MPLHASRFIFSDSAISNKRGKPAGALAVWQFQGSATKSRHEITFADSVPSGQPIWIRCAWINRKQEVGPMSLPVTTNIQGGVASAVVPAVEPWQLFFFLSGLGLKIPGHHGVRAISDSA
ncbi:MAG: hypothetical protein IT447_03880 [Phycisphaerales bacterium]|jgi:hypothetical protein|nr:hypothetical protein [Phycisphaerales bacterium]